MSSAPKNTLLNEDGSHVDTALTPELRTKVNYCESKTTMLGAIGLLCKMTAEAAARGAAQDSTFHDHDLYKRKPSAGII